MDEDLDANDLGDLSDELFAAMRTWLETLE